MAFDQLPQADGIEPRHVVRHVDPAVRLQITALVRQQLECVILVRDRLEFHHRQVAALFEGAVFIQHVSDATDMPAAKFRPVVPSTTTIPPVMYSQPWSPTPSMTAVVRRSCAPQTLTGDPRK